MLFGCGRIMNEKTIPIQIRRTVKRLPVRIVACVNAGLFEKFKCSGEFMFGEFAGFAGGEARIEFERAHADAF